MNSFHKTTQVSGYNDPRTNETSGYPNNPPSNQVHQLIQPAVAVSGLILLEKSDQDLGMFANVENVTNESFSIQFVFVVTV